jgi:glyoxylase-like metal-dependent hydrolase (beta-lactamase superfamily II)
MHCKRFPLGTLWTNTYVAWDESGVGFIVDPAEDMKEILSFVREKNISIKAVLLTHGHLDHVGGLKSWMSLQHSNLRNPAMPVYIGAGDAVMLRFPDGNTAKWMECDFEGMESFSTVKDGDTLSFGEMNVSVLETPGHTPGCVCYLASSEACVEKGEDLRLLFSGDTLFARSVGRTDLPRGDSETLHRSLVRLASLPDDLRVLPGHGPETTIGMERAHNPFWPEEEE